MTDLDLAAADELRRLAGWNQTLENWRQLLSFEPHGCFVAFEAARVIGTVTTTTYGRDLAWIGMMLVHPEHRRHGIGTRLMQAALDYLHAQGIGCIRLDATPAGQPVYERLGFVPEWTLTRHQGVAMPGPTLSGARILDKADWSALQELDKAAFGVGRERILRKLAESGVSTMVSPPQGPIVGYGMLRPGSQCDYLGPVVCTTLRAQSLILALLCRPTERPVFWDVPDANAETASLARNLGFAPVRHLMRMRLGPNSPPSNPAAQLAIADPSLG